MAKFEEVFEDTQKLFDEIMVKTELDRVLTIKLYANNTQKTLSSLKKESELGKLNTGIDVYIVLNEEIFDELPEPFKLLAVEEIISQIEFNPESGAIKLNKGDFQTPSGFLEKYGEDTVVSLKESIKSLYSAAKEKDKE